MVQPALFEVHLHPKQIICVITILIFAEFPNYKSNVKQFESYIIITKQMVYNFMFYNTPSMVLQESWKIVLPADCRGEKWSETQYPLAG